MNRPIRVMAVCVLCASGIETAYGQLDSTWTITVGGQTAVATDQGVRVANIAVPDNFGNNGPGSPPDSVGDDPVRLVGTSIAGGVVRYVFSEPFFIRQRRTFFFSDMELTFTDVPPPLPESIRVEGPSLPLDVKGNRTAQLVVLGTLRDGSERDLTPQSAWTRYRTSNVGVARVNGDGLVTANGPGFAFITASNDGATAVTRIRVVQNDPLTTVEGFVRLEDGSPAVGAQVTILGPGNVGTTGAAGFFSIPGVPTRDINNVDYGTYTVRARLQMGQGFLNSDDIVVTVMPGRLTDAGVIIVRPIVTTHGPIIVAGTDPEDHGAPGRQMILDIMQFVTTNSRVTHDPPRVLMLGGALSLENAARGITNELGFTLTRVTGAQILSVQFAEYDSVYMPTSASDVSGGLSPADLANINMRGQDLIDYLNVGGGIFAFHQSGSGAFGWFPLGALQISTQITNDCLMITPEGEPILSPSVTGATPYHNLFTGPPGFYGLDVLAIECPAPQRALIIGGIGQ